MSAFITSIPFPLHKPPTHPFHHTHPICHKPIQTPLMCLTPTPPTSHSQNRTLTPKPSRLSHLDTLIHSTPLFHKANLSKTFDLNSWTDLGEVLENELEGETGVRDDVRVYQYYLPVYFWLENMVRMEKERRKGKNGTVEGAVVVGLSCPQGGGKTTLTRYLCEMFERRGLCCVVASLDDFYYGYEDQSRLARKHEGNELLEYRGNPGTHDVDLLKDTLGCLKKGGSCFVPRYDKSAQGGRGDLCVKDKWREVMCREVDVVLFEGWCLGFQAMPKEEVEAFGDWRLGEVNEYLKEYAFLKEVLDAMVVVEVGDVGWVYKWREQAEERRRTGGNGAMSEKELAEFVSRFMPSYRMYLPYLYQHEFVPGKELRLRIDEKRRPVG